MAVKKSQEKTPANTEVKPSKEENKEKKSVAKKDKYFYAVGRRKTAVAQIFLYTGAGLKKDGSVVNNMSVENYFPTSTEQSIFFAPVKAVGLEDKSRVSVLVRGGGKKGQVEAARLGIARALVKFDGNLKKTLKGFGFLTRDARKVERKKPGLKKARRAPQWKKR
ncbi:30S ribosomal protein S9 [bacterium BMS3Abin15]|nr:30S ribosomal protein S9 [bacterium BMS3Abin15]HDZ85843.1 30S ribosomal protein S9 [Candidatus Moranbacteria bacterium]